MKFGLFVLAFVATALASPINDTNEPEPPKTYIFGGVEASRHEFPYQVSLQRYSLFAWRHICGASIISHNWLVSAAHCTQNAANSYRAIAGLLDLNENTSDLQEVSIVFIVNHPDYNPPLNGVAPHDISLLQLGHSLVWTTAVQPIAYPSQNYVEGLSAVLSGWGSIGGSILLPVMPNRLQKAVLPKVENAQCRQLLDAFISPGQVNPFDEWSNICSGPFTGGISACSGDSGGPWAEEGVLIGIVSWGISPCGSVGAPSVYARASSYGPWVRQYVPEI